jgi:hypothetical protein
MRTDTRQLATLNDQVFIANRATFEVAFQNFTGRRRV